MKLNVEKRSADSKGETNRIRRDGDIPAILYSKGKPGESLRVKGADFQAALRQLKKGHLPVTKFALVNGEGKETTAIVKGIQYHPTTYAVIHLDFEELHEGVTVDVRVPVEFTGVAECAGIKLGGVLRQVLRHFRVRCLPKDMPERFVLDVRGLSMKQSKRLRDIELPQGVKPLDRVEEVAVTIAKR